MHNARYRNRPLEKTVSMAQRALSLQRSLVCPGEHRGGTQNAQDSRLGNEAHSATRTSNTHTSATFSNYALGTGLFVHQ